MLFQVYLKKNIKHDIILNKPFQLVCLPSYRDVPDKFYLVICAKFFEINWKTFFCYCGTANRLFPLSQIA